MTLSNLVTEQILTEEEVVALNLWMLSLCHEMAGYPDATGESWEEYLNKDIFRALASKSFELAEAHEKASATCRTSMRIDGRPITQSGDAWQQLARENPRMIGLAFNLGAAGFTQELPHY